METREQALQYGLSFQDTYQDAPFHDDNWQLVRYKGNRKAFLWTYEKDGYVNLNVKVDPEKAFFWRDVYAAVIPAYHQNRRHWNTIILDGSIPDRDIKLMIAESYDLIADSPSRRIYEVVRRIPEGRVATYAQVAELAGDKKMARAVGNALHKNPDPFSIPCHRVVNARGELAGEYAFGGAWKQAEILESEGVAVIDGRVDLTRYQWQPGIDDAIARVREMEAIFDQLQEALAEAAFSEPPVGDGAATLDPQPVSSGSPAGDACSSEPPAGDGAETPDPQPVSSEPPAGDASYIECRSLIRKLEEYYMSPQWKADFAADERGEFPTDLKRGVLSEDGIYNLLEELRDRGLD